MANQSRDCGRAWIPQQLATGRGLLGIFPAEALTNKSRLLWTSGTDDRLGLGESRVMIFGLTRREDLYLPM